MGAEVRVADSGVIFMRAGEVRRVEVPCICNTLCLLVRPDVNIDGKVDQSGGQVTWVCEDLKTGRERVVSSRYMSRETFNEMEVLAWASR